jgi:PPM family protein phosphatase
MTVLASAATDTGLVRERNEDRFWIDAERGVFLVVDGVGGQAAGEVAAETAVDAFRDAIFQPGTPEARIRAAIAHANNCIFERATGDLQGMACVLTAALVEDGEVTVGHVGDSRLYLIWRGAIRKITSDHSPVGEEEDAGALAEEQAMSHPRRNEVFREVGSRRRQADDEGFIEIRRCRFRPDAALLLCSDGLTDLLTSARVREIIERYDGDPARVACDLVEAANLAGGIDNITALFVAGSEFRGKPSGSLCGTETRPRLGTTRLKSPGSVFTGRLAFMAYGLMLGMLLWAVVHGVKL